MKTLEDMQKSKDVAYGLEVRKRRDDLRITQKKLAKRIGIKQTTLSSYELGLEKCPAHIRMRIEKVLGPIEVGLELDKQEDSAQKQAEKQAGAAANEILQQPSEEKTEGVVCNIKNRLNALLEQTGLSRNSLGKLMGFSSSTVSMVLNGSWVPKQQETIDKLISRIERAERYVDQSNQMRLEEIDVDKQAVRERRSRQNQRDESWLKEYKRLSIRLRNFRIDHGLSQGILASMIGNTEDSTISKYENCKGRPTAIKMVFISRRLDELEAMYQRGGATPEDIIVSNMLNVSVNKDALHEEIAAAYDPEPASETVSGPLPREVTLGPQPSIDYKEYSRREKDRHSILTDHGVVELSDDAFHRLINILDDMTCSRKNLDARFAGVDD